jgi:hypothetical protein
VPLFHIAGSNFVIAAVMGGMTLIQLIAFDPIKELELLDKEKGPAPSAFRPCSSSVHLVGGCLCGFQVIVRR